MFKVDFHTHSNLSPDGGIKPEQYLRAFEYGGFNFIAITDHNSISAALTLKKTLGEKIIVGEEIMTTEGEIIGLFLDKNISPGLTPAQTVKAIKDQGGLVYIPHPLETVRSGLSESVLDSIVQYIDIVEVHNGRAVFQNRGPETARWARINHKVVAASSDAHGYKGLGTTFTQVTKPPTAKNLVELLDTARFTTNRPPLKTLLYPKFNKLRKRIASK